MAKDRAQPDGIGGDGPVLEKGHDEEEGKVKDPVRSPQRNFLDLMAFPA